MTAQIVAAWDLFRAPGVKVSSLLSRTEFSVHNIRIVSSFHRSTE